MSSRSSLWWEYVGRPTNEGLSHFRGCSCLTRQKIRKFVAGLLVFLEICISFRFWGTINLFTEELTLRCALEPKLSLNNVGFSTKVVTYNRNWANAQYFRHSMTNGTQWSLSTNCISPFLSCVISQRRWI